MTWPNQVRVVEVGPRDGLQNEARILEAKDKIALIENLVNAGLRSVECGSFVSPRRVPQMANTAEVFSGLRRVPGVTYSALVPNLEAFTAALQCQVDEVAVFVAASETFSQKNINCTIAESLKRAKPVADQAKSSGLRLRGYVSCVLGCPYEGRIEPEKVADVSNALLALGCDEISLGDTIGVGTPGAVQRLLRQLNIPIDKLAVHFHDTYGQALANVLAALDCGIGVVDASVAGLGGCPFAPGAAGNLATEDLVYMLAGMGISTGVNLHQLVHAGRTVCKLLGRSPASRVAAALA